MKKSKRRAIKIVEKSKRSHEQDLDWITAIGGKKFHRKCIRQYERVLKELRK
jgi:hypothetical protein